MDLLGRMLREEPNSSVTLSAALAKLARREQYLALEDAGKRYDLGARYGMLIAELALSLNGRDRDEVLSALLGLLAEREMAAPSAGSEQ
jgi:UTP--glucose-1-phosphate uridylyltransferase